MSSLPHPQAGAPATIYSSRAWRVSLGLVGVLVGTFLLYWPSAGSLIDLWNDTGRITYTHGFIIAALSVWLVIRRRDELAGQVISPSLVASALAVLAGGVWLLGVRAGIEVVHQAMLVVLLWLAVWAVFGLAIARIVWIPVGFLLFAVPVWDLGNPILQSMTTHAVHALLQVAGIPAYVDGNVVHLAAGVFEVAGGCSGLHFFLVSIALGTLNGEVGRDSYKVRAVLLGMAIGFALLSNWLRVFIIVVAGHLTDMQHYLIREEHYTFGWVVFAVMMFTYLVIVRRLVPSRARAEAPLPAVNASLPAPRLVPLVVAAAGVVLVPLLEIFDPVVAAPVPAAGSTLPAAPAGWSRGEDSDWAPTHKGADLVERATYVRGGLAPVTAYTATYLAQHQDKELVAYDNTLLGPGEGVVGTAAAGADRELAVEGPGLSSVIRYHYRVGDAQITRDVVAQLRYGLDALMQPTLSSVVALRAPCVPDCDAARRALDEFAAR